jgi:hypothetical protein
MSINETFRGVRNECVGRKYRIIVKLVLYDNDGFIRLVGNRPAALFNPHRQTGLCIEPDTINPLDGILSVLAGAYLEAYAISCVNLMKLLLVIERSEQIRMGLRSNAIPPFTE